MGKACCVLGVIDNLADLAAAVLPLAWWKKTDSRGNLRKNATSSAVMDPFLFLFMVFLASFVKHCYTWIPNTHWVCLSLEINLDSIKPPVAPWVSDPTHLGMVHGGSMERSFYEESGMKHMTWRLGTPCLDTPTIDTCMYTYNYIISIYIYIYIV